MVVLQHMCSWVMYRMQCQLNEPWEASQSAALLHTSTSIPAAPSYSDSCHGGVEAVK